MVTSRPKNETNDNATRLSVYMPSGYHGDPHLMALVDSLAAQCKQFIETGTEAGSTVGYTARMYPHLKCYTTETDKGTHELAAHNLSNHQNIDMFNQHSLDFLKGLQPESPVLGWLDAHSHGWGCDLGEEVDIVLDRWESGFLFLDDFEVPGHSEFGFDWYDSYGKLNWETIKKDITPEMLKRIDGIYYPNYKPQFGARGTCLIAFGGLQYTIPEDWKE